MTGMVPRAAKTVKAASTEQARRPVAKLFEIIDASDVEARADADEDVIFLVVRADHEDPQCVTLELPQFGIELYADEREDEPQQWAANAFRVAVQRMLAFYRALTELDDEYITEVEQAQQRIIERVLLPWLARTLAKNPALVVVPEDEVTAVFDKVLA